MTRSLSPFVLDLRGVPVRPERIVDLAQRVCARGFDPAIDWGERFPWRVDSRVSRDAYPEEVVAAVDRQARDTDRSVLIVMRDPIPVGYSARVAYRGLWRSASGSNPTLSRSVAKLQSDLIDDALELTPALAGIVAVGAVDDADPPGGPRYAAWNSLGAACAASRLDFLRADASDSFWSGGSDPRRVAPDVEDDDPVGGVEERVALQGLVDGESVVDAHRALRAWRADAWVLVGRLHQAVTDAADRAGVADAFLVGLLARLRHHVRTFSPLVRAVEQAYAERFDRDAARHHLRRVAAPVREQLATLSARVSVVRSAR